ncbi:glyoxylase-like metal-dependent hydrolase (beta-lactamase superfamily II) [Nocardia transvalensis]|uniref:Glyoxylase-like metal-dependent hydrolase (Beta-lactamase superfamily II) n=1 Tax=Nocardia transvalensis TaxID=37333 RepID=A0A7W9PF05_9NOCA|nr:MBL fold metallo-hydrolase [Nocardia transvalensis]MBB5914458.1 glyoxylase-like metal-dependent hydrolase (beta-lactamase superfamily II) [Nocardia transvalensis]
MTQADLSGRLNTAPGIRSIRLGETKVSFVPDGAVQGRPLEWLPATTPETWADHPEYLDSAGYLVAGIGGLLVERGDRALLIDAGFGPQSAPAEPGSPNGAIYGGALVTSLAELGRTPAEIESVAFTHLHPDHIGWAWHPAPGDDQPVFTHAEYLVAEPEWSPRDLLESGTATPDIIAALAPRVRTIAEGQEIFPGVEIRMMDGHTGGHAGYVITDGDTRLIAFGDAFHSPLQITHPEWSCVYDHNPLRATEHRRHLLTELEQPGTIGFGNHFADAVFGQVRQEPEGRTWHPLNP